MQAACGIDYVAALAGGIETFTVQGIEIPVAGKELLIRMKDTVRPRGGHPARRPGRR